MSFAKEQKKYKRCKRCALTADYAFAEIDENGECKFCRSFREKDFSGTEKLVQDLDLKPGEKVGVNVSGGKDSIYMWGRLSEILGADRIVAFSFYRPGITSETAMENVYKTQAILGSELVVLTDQDAFERFRKNLEILLDDPHPEKVRILLCAGCRHGITGRLYEAGMQKNVYKYFSGASYLELAPFKEELIAACSETNDLDDGFESIIRSCPALDHGNNLEVIRKDHHLKYKNNDTMTCQITDWPDIQLFDFDTYFENNPARIEEEVREKYGWQKTDRSWHFDCTIENLKDVFYYGSLGYTELDFRASAMVRNGLISREKAIQRVEDANRKVAYSYYRVLEQLRDYRLDHKKEQLDAFYRNSPYLMSPVDFHDYIGKHVHMIGIGGASMCGLAGFLKERGCLVTGSDQLDGENVQKLLGQGISVTVGQHAENVAGADLVVYSMAVPEDHVELQACREKGIPIMERSVLLGQLSGEYPTSVSVCGTHGKTTVTSMLTQVLVECGFDPSVHIGGELPSIGGSVRQGKGTVFLTEACEYRRNFMNIRSKQAILLNIDTDHLDYYQDLDEIESSFGDFMRKLPSDGWGLGNGDDERVVRQLKTLGCPYETFGTSEKCDYRMRNLKEDEEGFVQFDLLYHDRQLCHAVLSVPGRFNGMNALAALSAAHHLGADMQQAAEAIRHFTGAHRRFEKTGECNGAELFHDYGHNPAEMKNAVSIARKRCRGGKLWAVIQPHTYSRVKTLFEEYLDCTKEADITLVTDIFAAREKDPGDINAGMLVDAMKQKGIHAELTPGFEDAAKAVREGAQKGDLVITMGCGDVYKLNDILNQETT